MKTTHLQTFTTTKNATKKYDLTQNDIKIIKMHYGLPPYRQPLSFSEIGTRLKINRNAARSAFVKAIKKLKHTSNASHYLHKHIPDLNAPPPPASKKFLYHPPEPSKTLNLNLLRLLRESANITQNQIADILSLRHYTYSKAEQGKNHFSLPVFREICILFNLDPLSICVLLNLPFPDKTTYINFLNTCKKLGTNPKEAIKEFILIFNNQENDK